jgi:hypothetical protein
LGLATAESFPTRELLVATPLYQNPRTKYDAICETDHLAALLDRRTRDRFWSVFFGLLLCREKRRTASAWFRAGGIGTDFRRAYDLLGSVGRRVGLLGTVLLRALERVAGVGQPVETFAFHGLTHSTGDAADRELQVDAAATTVEVADSTRGLVVEGAMSGAAYAAGRFFRRRRRVMTTA